MNFEAVSLLDKSASFQIKSKDSIPLINYGPLLLINSSTHCRLAQIALCPPMLTS